ncbi:MULTISPECIES: LysE/ArgO family amino acid transporter [unclassified Microbacterium]|uniref:LysE/ArgO family amino acid transporter n=1 Tax=unclassified Microbacterium TaxID=2609290 RepID=UPI001DE5C2CF|nr:MULTISPECIES: LysE/ArgO family amino acid transporter [unclassified Microbacterium]CAH0196031.1 Arginine exporter protein ArgO [Microbacterium sp. Bi121]HWK78969.1 LysE/ArgO family amino acid transporter [Microbacterium sp.]
MISFLAGLGLGLSLIVAIGAQNAFVLRQGIRREHVLAVIIICALSDAVLIVAGVAGLGFLIERMPWLVVVAQWLGAAFLLTYGLLAARRALRGTDLGLSAQALTRARPGGRLVPVVLTVLALTWLNPHVYLDTVLMLGSIAATHGDERWIFAAGAVVASIVWFTALGYGARYLGRWLNTARAWRILDGVIAVIMIALAVSLIVQAVSG